MLVKLFNKITALSLRFRWIVIALSLAIIGLGIYALIGLNLELLPRIEFPQTVVVAQWSDAESSEQFLEEITIPLEDTISGIDGVVNVESTTSSSFAFIIARNEFGLDQDKVVDDIEESVALLSFPEGVETPEVLRFSLSDLPVVVASASSSELSLAELKDLVSNDLQPRLENIEEIDQVSITGGQELPEEGESSSEVSEPAETEADTSSAAEEEDVVDADPGRLPDFLIESARSFGVEIEYAQDITPEFLGNLGVDVDPAQLVATLALFPAETWRYAPAETLAVLPAEYVSTFDLALRDELDQLAAEFGGVGQYTADEVVAMFAEESLEAAGDGEGEAAGEDEVPEQSEQEVLELPEVEPVPLPESWIEASAQAGQQLETTADITPEVIGLIQSFAPQLFADLEPAMWLALDPAAVVIVLPDISQEMDPILLSRLEAIQLASQGIAPVSVDLPQPWIDAAASVGQTLQTTTDVPAEGLVLLVSNLPQLLGELTEDVILAFAPDQLAVLPEEYVSTLDDELQQTISNIAVHAERYLALAEESGEMDAPAQAVEPIPLPESWVDTAAQFGQTVETTADIRAEILMGTAAQFPQLLLDLEPAMWRAIDPEVVAPLMPELEAILDPQLVIQLVAIQAAHQGVRVEPQPLPETWIELATANGFPVETTEDIPADMAPLLISSVPELLADLTPDTLLAFSPEILSILPEDYLATLDEGVQDTINIILIHHAAVAVGTEEEAVDEEPTAGEEPTGEEDPARLPEALIQGAQSFGLDIEFAYDLPPEFMNQIAGLGTQGLQVLRMLTPDNLRALQPEAIALLPGAFLEEIDPDLLAELDALAVDYGGAGQLALEQEETEKEEVDLDAPPLSGIWLEPSPTGEPSQFQTASDILNNPFVPGAAAFLNFFPDSPQVEDPVEWMQALTREVIAYLAENEADFVSTLSPVILEMMSPEVLSFLLENYPEAFDESLTQRLQGIAAGEVEVFVPESTITRTDGNPSIVLNLFKAGDANTVEVAHEVFDELAAFESENSEVSFSFVFEQASFIEESISTVAREGLLGAFFAMIIILIFLSGRVGGKFKLSWRATLVVGVSIPLSVFAAIIIMRWMPPTLGVWINDLASESGNGFLTFAARLFPRTVTLNIMTLSGMTVAIGRVVDDSIVVLENSFRFIQKGGDRRTAVLNGTKEVAIAIFASTATTVAVFLPLGLVGGIIGSFFLPFGMTVTYALAASFVVAITVIPALTFTLISRDQIPEERETRMQKTYTPPLEWALHHRGITMAIAAAIFLGSMYLLSTLPQSFIPELGEPSVNVGVQLNNGAQMADTDALVMEFEEAVKDVEGIERVQSEIGSGGGFEAFFAGGGINQGQANLTISVEDQEMLADITNEVRDTAEEIFGADNTVVSAASQTGFSGFSLIVTGESLEQLVPVVKDVKEALGSVDIDNDGIPDIANVSSSVDQAALPGESTIIRIDGRPAISFGGELETENTLGVTNLAKEKISDLPNLPAGVEVTEGFESEQQTQGFQQMITAIGYSIVIVYFIMALTFKSLIHPFTILFSLPFAVVGAALALYLSGSVLGISSMIGLMMLVGIVVTNAIVLLELVQQLRQRGTVAYDALVQGGRTRLRPIWMTALTAVLALMPLALSQESGAIIASELAITVIGGLLVSTFLTLLVVPVVYSLFDDLGGMFRRRFSRE